MSQKTIPLVIITPERLAFQTDAIMVTAPTATGEIGVLPDHVPLYTRLVDGEVKVTTSDSEYFLAVGSGYLETTGDKITILVTSAAKAEELDEARIKKAKEDAERILKEKPTDTSVREAAMQLRRSILELSVLERQRKRRIV